MFWRRKTSSASTSSSGSKRQKQSGVSNNDGGDDEIAQLQRQFGIKPVSDADVQAEFRSLFGTGAAATSGGASGLSPRSELLLFGANGNDDDDEAAILRSLNIHGTSVDKIDVDALDLSDDDDDDDGHTNDGGAAKRELAGVLRDVHATAAQSQSDPLQLATPTQATGAPHTLNGDVAARVRALKLEALAHKREGNVKEALVLFRQAKELEAHAAAPSPPAVARIAPQKAPVALDTSAPDVDDDADDVHVTDEDMKDPAYLAQLAALGIAPDDDDDAPVDTVASLTAALQDAKLEALRHKRNNEIQDALRCMRRVRDLEAKLAALSVSAGAVTHASVATVVTTETVARSVPSDRQSVVERQTQASAVEVVHAYTSAATAPGDEDDDEDVDVTDADMDDPAFAAELATLGFAPSSDSSASRHASLDGVQSVETRFERAETVESVRSIGGASGRALQSALSTGDEDLIDAFEDSSDDDDDEDASAPTAGASSTSYGVLAAEAAPAVPLPPVPTAPTAPDDSRVIADLEAQLQATKETAVRLKRSGDIQGALDAMRRIKQIESLLAHKQTQQQNALAPPPVRHDPATQAQFHALEQLLVDFGNRALALAKEHLSTDRAKATEWLNKVRLLSSVSRSRLSRSDLLLLL